jgi:hypothetical protein
MTSLLPVMLALRQCNKTAPHFSILPACAIHHLPQLADIVCYAVERIALRVKTRCNQKS